MGYKTAALALALAFVTSPLVAQFQGVAFGSVEDSTADGSFGLGNQDLFLSAFGFNPDGPNEIWNDIGQGYFYQTATGIGQFVAPITLPAGARITAITCYFYDVHATEEAEVRLLRYTYNTSTHTPSVEHVQPSILSVGTGGYQTQFATFDETIRYRPSLFTRSFYALLVLMPSSTQVWFRGCNVTWNRQVTPAPASATFADVPVGHPYHQFIEALVDSGITSGCGGGLYCVDAPITRGEMAVFLAAALGLHFPN